MNVQMHVVSFPGVSMAFVSPGCCVELCIHEGFRILSARFIVVVHPEIIAVSTVEAEVWDSVSVSSL